MRHTWCGCISAVLLSGVQTAVAQSVDAETGALAEIVVTAQKRGEKLQDVPISVIATSNEQLAAAGVNSTEALGIVVPGLSLQETSGALQPHIRGVGTSANGAGIESPVATYVDGVYYANASSAILTLSDIDHVEVLKGPQGTLFGRNTTGGLIQIITRDPSHELSGKTQLTYGKYQDWSGNVYVTGGLTDTLASSLSVRYEHQGQGYGTNLFNGDPIERMDHDYVIRNKYLFEPTEATQVRLSLDYEDRLSSFLTQHPLDEGMSGAANPLILNTPANGGPFAVPTGRDENVGFTDFALVKVGGAALNVKQDLGFATLTSISAYRDSAFYYGLDIDYTQLGATVLRLTQRDKQASQEFQISSAPSSPLKWVAGLYYFWAKDAWDPLGIYLTGPSAAPLPEVDIHIRDSQLTNAYAAYAQATYEVLADTNLTLGARYSYESKNWGGTQTTSFPGLPIPPILAPAATGAYPNHFHADKPSYRVSLDHKFNSDLMAYASWTTGFKSGGFNLAAPGEQPYLPELVTAEEVGLKTEWLDRRLRVNAAAFHYDYSNIQIGYFVFGSEAFRNGAKAEIYGADLDLEAAVTSQLSVTGGVSYLHDRFLTFPNAPYAIPGVLCSDTSNAPLCAGDASGNRLPYTPTATFNLGANYNVDVGYGKLNVSANYLHSTGWFASPDNTLRQPGYQLVNASAAWTHPEGRLEVRLWGSNLTDELYSISMLEGPQGDARTLGAPRTYGVTVSYAFGGELRK